MTLNYPKTKAKNEESSELKIPSIDEIKFALKIVTLFEAIIVLMCSAMGRSEIINLTTQDLINSISKYQKIS